MPSRTQAFATLTGKLRDALVAGDWAAIATLDEECRALVASLRDEDASDVGLRDQLESLTNLYGELQHSGRNERERLIGELTRLSQSKHVNQAYTPLD